MNKPSILYIITQGTWGGAQRYVFDLASNLRNDFSITIAVGSPHEKQDLQQKATISSLPVIQLTHLVREISLIHDLLAIKELARLYDRNKPDIVHLNSSKAGIIGSFAKLWSTHKPKIVYTVHGWVFNEPLPTTKKWLYTALEKWTSKLKDSIIVLSGEEKIDAVKKLSIHDTKLSIIPIGIDTTKPQLSKQKAREALFQLTGINFSSKQYWVGTIANFYPTKGLDILIEAVNILKKEHRADNIGYIVLGDGPERKSLEHLITSYKLDNCVHLPGFYPDADQYLPAFELFALPSRKEGLPYTLLEATTANLSCIATKVGGIPSLGRQLPNIHLVEPNDPQGLAAQILEYIQKIDPLPKVDVSDFDLKITIKQIKVLYLSHPQSSK